MNIKDYVESEGLTFEVGPAEGDAERVLKVGRAGATMETKVRLVSGPFDGEKFVRALRQGLRDIEAAEGIGTTDAKEQARVRASMDALGPQGRVQFFKVRDDFKGLVGPASFRRLLDDVEP